ncbi:platelet-derived growth factor receptor-like protein [Manacus vitellinus]|nr:platelet-derived growth factor receptor-like protein [Manacus vitellinus]
MIALTMRTPLPSKLILRTVFRDIWARRAPAGSPVAPPAQPSLPRSPLPSQLRARRQPRALPLCRATRAEPLRARRELAASAPRAAQRRRPFQQRDPRGSAGPPGPSGSSASSRPLPAEAPGPRPRRPAPAPQRSAPAAPACGSWCSYSLPLLLLLLLQEALPHVIGQPAKSKRPKEHGENKVFNKKVKPKTPKMKERESADSSLKSQSILTQVMDKGRIQKLAATLSLSAGQSIELRCKGSNVTWNYPSYLDTFKDSRLSIKQLERYGQLILANSTAADTGEYSCWLQLCNGNKCRKDETKTGSTYIFFTDKEELFVPTPSYFEIVYLNPDKPAVIPCRVTTPSAKVTLHREFPAEEIETDGTDLIYDAKKGFVYQHPTSDHKGIVYCKAESQGAPQISIKYHLLYVEVPKGPPSATLAVSSNRAQLGDSVQVICTVLGEPDVDVNFRWQYPGRESERPVIIQNFWRLINRGAGHTTRISKSVLLVENFEAKDAGNYICIAQNLQGETTVATKVELN